MLVHRLESIGCDIHHAREDADVLVAKTAIACAKIEDIVVVADDTDILVPLIHHSEHAKHGIRFKPNHKKGGEKVQRCWNISATRHHLGSIFCSSILFAHAGLGCDTTSRPYGLGKGKAVSKLRSDNFFMMQASVLMSSVSVKEDIVKAWDRGTLALYGGTQNETLADLRLRSSFRRLEAVLL